MISSVKKRVVFWVLAAVLSGAGFAAFAQTSPEASKPNSSTLNSFQMVQQENLMLHFDLDQRDTKVNIFTLTEPDRLVIDLPEATLGTQLPNETFDTGVVERIRYAQHGDEYLRVVLDLRQSVSPSAHLVPLQDGQRLIIDTGVPADPSLNSNDTTIDAAVQTSMQANTQPQGQTQPAPRSRTRPEQEARDVVIAIDAGHGGKDPGAIGRRKTNEKDVVLAIAIRLHNQLMAMAGIRPVLIRDDDVYIDLRERMERARRAGADIFVSIHADAIKGGIARGSSVYALSVDGATSEAAAWLAKSENDAAALYGDVSLNGMDDGLAKTLLDLTQGNTMERSIEVGTDVLAELAMIGPVHKVTVEQASFAVLKSPDIPSILIETAFISNPDEEEKLNSANYQEQIAVSIAKGLYAYLLKRAPAGTSLATRS